MTTITTIPTTAGPLHEAPPASGASLPTAALAVAHRTMRKFLRTLS